MRHRRIAQLTVFVLLLHLPHVGFAQKLEENTDRHGEDFRDFDLPTPDPLLCRKACVEDNQCRSFTYLKPNTGPGSPQVAHCWLKDGIPAAKRDPAFVSGVVPKKTMPPEKTLPPGKPGEWVIQERWAGGLSGGASSFLIRSDGHFRKENKFQRNKPQEGSVPPEALRKLNAAILAAKLSTWKHSDGTAGCCDQVTTTFLLEVCGPDGKWKRYSSTLYAGSSLPADMEAVLAAMKF